MTEEELKANIDAGREWLEAHGFFIDADHADGYFHKMPWSNDDYATVEIQEPDMKRAKSIIEGGMGNNLDIWLCHVKFGLETDPDRTCTWGATPKEALERSLEEYDKEMARYREQRFGVILNEEKALPEAVSASLSETWERPLNPPPVKRLKGEKIVLVDGHVVSKRDVDVYCREV